jgi:hypothetical protein
VSFELKWREMRLISETLKAERSGSSARFRAMAEASGVPRLAGRHSDQVKWK